MNPYIRKDYVTTIGAAGDFANETAWLAAFDEDISVRTCQVFNIEDLSSDFTIGETVDFEDDFDEDLTTAGTSHATGVVIHNTSTQLLVKTVTGGPIVRGMAVRGQTSAEYCRITDAGRLPNIVGEWIDATAVTGGYTITASSRVGGTDGNQIEGWYVLRPASSLTVPGTWTGSKQFSNAAGVGLTIELPYFRLEGCAVGGRDGGVLVDPGSGKVVLGSVIAVGPTSQTGNPHGIDVETGTCLVQGSASYGWAGSGVRVQTTGTCHIRQSTLYRNGEYGAVRAGAGVLNVRDTVSISNVIAPYLNVGTANNNVINATRYQLGFSVPDYGDATGWDLHYGEVVVSQATTEAQVYRKGNPDLDDDIDGFGYWHPRGLDYWPKPQGPARPGYQGLTAGPMDIGADDYHHPYTPSGVDWEEIAPSDAGGGYSHWKYRLTGDKTAAGSAFFLRRDVCLRLDGHTVTYGDDPTVITNGDQYMSMGLGISDAGSGSLWVCEAGGVIKRIQVNATTGEVTIAQRIGGWGTGNAEFKVPTQAVQLGADLFVCDCGRQRVVKLTAATGAYDSAYDLTTQDEGVRPWGIATNGTDRIYVADHRSPKIYVFDANLALQATWDFETWMDGIGQFDYMNEPVPRFSYELAYRGGRLFVVMTYLTIRFDAIVGDTQPTVDWYSTRGGTGIDADGTYCYIRQTDEVSPASYVRRFNVATGADVDAYSVGVTGAVGWPGWGGAIDSNSGDFVMCGDEVFQHVEHPGILVWDTTTLAEKWRGMRTSSVSGFFFAGPTNLRHWHRSMDRTTDIADVGRSGVYGGYIVQGAGVARSNAIYSSSSDCFFHDLDVTIENVGSHFFYGVYGQFCRLERNVVHNTGHFVSEEARDRHRGAGEICTTEAVTFVGFRVMDNEIYGGPGVGLRVGGYPTGYAAATVERNFFGMDTSTWFRPDAAPTNLHGILNYGYDTTIRYNEIATLRGHGIGSYSGSSECNYQYNRAMGSYRSTTERYPFEGSWFRSVSNSIISDTQLLAYKRFATDRWSSGHYLICTSGGNQLVDCELYARRMYIDDLTGLAAIQIGQNSGGTWEADGCTFNAEGSVISIYASAAVSSPTPQCTFRDCTFQQVLGRNGAEWRHTIHIQQDLTTNYTVTFEDCVWEQNASPESVYMDEVRANTIRLTHNNHCQIYVTDAGAPSVGATVRIYDKQNTLVAQGTTDGAGLCTPLRVDTGNEHIFALEWTNTGGLNNRGPHTAWAQDSGGTKTGEITVDLTDGPLDNQEVKIVVGGGNPAPTVTSVSPDTGPTTGGVGVTITGTGFDVAGATVTFGGVPATNVTVVGATSITCDEPAYGSAGYVTVAVNNTADNKTGTLPNGYLYYVPAGEPVAYADTFDSGPLGANWLECTESVSTVAQIGAGGAWGHKDPGDNQAADGCVVKYTGSQTNDQKVTLKVAVEDLGTDDYAWCFAVCCRMAGTTWDTDLDGYYMSWYGVEGGPADYSYVQFRKWDGALGDSAISNLSLTGPAPAAGEIWTMEIEVNGTNFNFRIWDGDDNLVLDESRTDASFASGVGGWGFPIAAPGGPPAAQYDDYYCTEVTLTNLSGAPPNPTPTVSGVVANSGPTSGGTNVTVSGTNFTSGPRVTFGGVDATNVVYVNPTTITCTTPQAAGPGAVECRVIDANDQEGFLSGAFTYLATPTITSILPATGPIAGGTRVNILGTEFFPNFTVTFGGTPGILPLWVDRTLIQITTPALGVAGQVDVVVTNTDAQSDTVVNGFRFTSPPLPSQDPVVVDQLEFSATVHVTKKDTITRRKNPARLDQTRRLDEYPTNFQKKKDWTIEQPKRDTGVNQ